MYKEFKIKNLSSWADIEMFNGYTRFEFSASSIFGFSFNVLILAIIESFKEGSKTGIVRFDMEAKGRMDMLLINYADDLLKIELYENTDWDSYSDYFENLPVPIPVFSMLTTHTNFARLVIKALDTYKPEDFDCWDIDFIHKHLPQLKEMTNYKK